MPREDFDERNAARRRAEQRQQSSWFKLKEGENAFRILPTPKTKTVKTNWFEYAVHREVGPKKATVRCGVDPVSGEGECWLCSVKVPQLKKKGQEERARALAARAQLLVHVAKVDPDSGKMSGPFLFTPSKQIGDQLLASIFGSRKRDYVDPVKGFNINISRTGTGRNDTRYGVLEPDQEPSKVPAAILEKLKPFEELKEVPIYSKAKQEAAYLGQDIAEEEAEEEEEQPRSRTRRRADEDEDEEEATKPAADEDEDEAEPVEDEDEEEAPPKPKRKPPVVEDEDEEEEEAPKPKRKQPVAEEDEDEEEPPARKPKARVVEEEDEDEEEPPARKPKAGVKAKAVEEDEDEDIPDDLEDEELPADEEEEEPPARKPKAGKKPPVEEEDEEEEPPARTAKKPAAAPEPKPRKRR